MGYNCKILLDSISETGKRLTTFEITFPRIVLAEFNTHRMFSRNSASSRAIPFKKRLEAVNDNPFIPDRFPVDGKGMQPNRYVDATIQPKDYEYVKEVWLKCRDNAVASAKHLYAAFTDYDVSTEEVHIHKQIVNRLLEPFQWHTVIVTATEFDNFFKLRTHPDAQYEIKRIADLMYEAYHKFDAEIEDSSFWSSDQCNTHVEKEWSAVRPQKLKVGEWHCPLVSWGVGTEDYELITDFIQHNHSSKFGEMGNARSWMESIRKQVSVARCARVSYLTHDGKRDIEKDLELFERLRTSGHWSPFEHVATPYFISETTKPLVVKNIKELEETRKGTEGWYNAKDGSYAIDLVSGNFIGWKQYRKEFADENCTNFRKELC